MQKSSSTKTKASLFVFKLAESEGFEPPVRGKADNRFRVCPVRPLRQLSLEAPKLKKI
jgi:hypothetical protein